MITIYVFSPKCTNAVAGLTNSDYWLVLEKLTQQIDCLPITIHQIGPARQSYRLLYVGVYQVFRHPALRKPRIPVPLVKLLQ